jgi:hypothetical protein
MISSWKLVNGSAFNFGIGVPRFKQLIEAPECGCFIKLQFKVHQDWQSAGGELRLSAPARD